MTYDPEARRDTPLALKLKERIRREGPITVAEYMRACLHDPEHGYYRRMPAIGAAGDFVTAPEISQVFGELIGLWCAVVWQQMGAPEVVHLVELGPGRGTMMRDALRAARVLPGFREAVRVHLVESNATLREVQRETLAASGVPVSWSRELSEIEDAIPPSGSGTIVVGNEYLDALAIEQSIFRSGIWRDRCVGLDTAGRLVYCEGAQLDGFKPLWRETRIAQDGDIEERCPEFLIVSMDLARIAAKGPLVALFIDYGHAGPAAGETLQAVLAHAPVSPLLAPGESDLTAHVDFALLAGICMDAGLVDGPVTQAEFLGSLGIVERASRLMAANPAKAGEIETGVARLIAPNARGSRFKAIGIRSLDLPPLPGFPVKGKA